MPPLCGTRITISWLFLPHCSSDLTNYVVRSCLKSEVESWVASSSPHSCVRHISAVTTPVTIP